MDKPNLDRWHIRDIPPIADGEDIQKFLQADPLKWQVTYEKTFEVRNFQGKRILVAQVRAGAAPPNMFARIAGHPVTIVKHEPRQKAADTAATPMITARPATGSKRPYSPEPTMQVEATAVDSAALPAHNQQHHLQLALAAPRLTL